MKKSQKIKVRIANKRKMNLTDSFEKFCCVKKIKNLTLF